MSVEPAARVGDPFCHSLAMDGALAGLMVGAVIVVGVAATIATGGLAGAAAVIAVGAAVSATGGLGMAGAYIGDSVPGPTTGTLAVGSPNVWIDARPAALVVIGAGSCAREGGVVQHVATGAATVHINGLPAARVREKLTCSAVIQHGSPDVVIGGPSVGSLPVTPEVPGWLSTTMQAMMWGGLAVATGGTAFLYGAAVAAGGLALGLVGSKLGGEGARALAAKLGAGETGQRVAEVVGGAVGGFAGGAAGAKGGGLVKGPLGAPLAEMPVFGGAKPSAAGASAAAEATARRDYLNDKFGRSGDLQHDINVRGRQETARNFFKSQGVSDVDAASYMKGYDFNYPVEVQTLNSGKSLWQYQTPGAPQGNWYSPTSSVSPGELGINPEGFNRTTQAVEPKVLNPYTTTGKVPVLKGTSAPIVDSWSVQGVDYSAPGGATQMFSNSKSSFGLAPGGSGGF